MGPEGLAPPALRLAEPKMDVGRNAHETEDPRIEAQVLFHHFGAVSEQGLLDRDAREPATARESQDPEKLRRRRLVSLLRIGKVLDQDILGDELRQVPGPSRVHERMNHEHLEPFPEGFGRAGRQGHLLDSDTSSRLVREDWIPGVLAERGQLDLRLEATGRQPEPPCPLQRVVGVGGEEIRRGGLWRCSRHAIRRLPGPCTFPRRHGRHQHVGQLRQSPHVAGLQGAPGCFPRVRGDRLCRRLPRVDQLEGLQRC